MAEPEGTPSTSTAASTISSTFSTGFSSYDVFLNFRGEDTRNSFTGCLNLVMRDKGINVFIDSEKLWIGEAIGQACLGAIRASKISIPVFSVGYANSKWCLLELAQIFHCYTSNTQKVFPVFFFIEPSNVRNQTGSLEKAFREHEKNFEPDIVNSWRKALKVIGDLKGEVIDTNKNQAEVIELVVKRVLDVLVSKTHLALCKYPIGIDYRVRNLLSLLSCGSDNVQFIGICGPPGIGKTTIAEAVYNCIFSTFNRHSFIPDVSKQAMQGLGLASLQKRLLKDMFNVDFDIGHYRKGKKLIENLLCNEKILLVLDDVDDKDQVDALAGELYWFGPKSMIIITTRSERILNVAKVEKEKIYWPQELDEEESLRLFSLHAFSMDEPPQHHMQLSHEIVRYSGGLPSTLEKLGYDLSDRSCTEEWKNTLRTLKAVKGKTSIFSVASLYKERSRTCPTKHNPHGWRPQLHKTIGMINYPVSRVSKVLGGYLHLNGFMVTDKVGNQSTTTKNQATLSVFNSEVLKPESSTAIDGIGHRLFTKEEIKTATRNFHPSCFIGEGGFGRVFKGVLEDGTKAAFKLAHLDGLQGRSEFEREIELLAKIKHRHVVSILGFCKDMDVMILVFEYLANGDLTKHLFGKSHLPQLTWKQRLEICIGVARGLLYLHTLGENGIIHRDIKSSNILLDENLVAKITDFGISRTGPEPDQTHVATRVMGTSGYVAPEYIMTGHLTLKSDIYSFGIVLLEVVSGRPAINRNKRQHIKEWALPILKRKRFESIVDPRLKGNFSPKSLKKFGNIAAKCIADKAKDRPTMEQVLQDLESCLAAA